MRRLATLLGCLPLVLGPGVGGADAARPAAEWSDDDLGVVLGRYVDGRGLVDYDAVVRDRAPLDRYVARLAETSPDNRPGLFPSAADRLAYWMNAYNALVLARVVEAWPVGGVREIRPLFGVFWLDRHTVGGKRFTLRGLENDVIRERFGDPRIHVGINCASLGCPPLPRRAWRGATLDADLDAAARRFVADGRYVEIDRDARVLRVSKIFEWFEDDFTGWMERNGLGGGVAGWIARYLPEEAAPPDLGSYRIVYREYDWSINDSGRDRGGS